MSTIHRLTVYLFTYLKHITRCAMLCHAVPCCALQVKFVPGRPDSTSADQDDQLPNFNDNFFHTLFYFLGNGESPCGFLEVICT